jgi:hypothetical protein
MGKLPCKSTMEVVFGYGGRIFELKWWSNHYRSIVNKKRSRKIELRERLYFSIYSNQLAYIT